MSNLHGVAKDLSSFLRKRKTAAVVEHEDAAVSSVERPARRIARATIDYVFSRLHEDCPQTIGQAIMIAADAAGEQTGVDASDIREEMIAVVEEILVAAKELR